MKPFSRKGLLIQCRSRIKGDFWSRVEAALQTAYNLEVRRKFMLLKTIETCGWSLKQHNLGKLTSMEAVHADAEVSVDME